MMRKSVDLRRASILGAAVAAALSLALGIGGYIGAVSIPDCAHVPEGSIAESPDFVPFDFQRSQPSNRAIVATDSSQNRDVPSSAKHGDSVIAGMRRQHTVATASGGVYAYFLDGDITGMSVADFMRAGGLELDQDPIGSAEPFAAALLDRFPERALKVRIGGNSGALTWADPDMNGTRTHNVYWSDSEHNYALISDRSAVEMVNFARDLAC